MGEQESPTAYEGQTEGTIPLMREEYVGNNVPVV
jgi:hypothetical protein